MNQMNIQDKEKYVEGLKGMKGVKGRIHRNRVLNGNILRGEKIIKNRIILSLPFLKLQRVLHFFLIILARVVAKFVNILQECIEFIWRVLE